MASQKSKFMAWIDYRVRVMIQDNRMLVGTFLAYDKHLNLVLSDVEEFRRIKPKKQGEPEKEIKRVLGMLILRGENIISITAEAAPQQSVKRDNIQQGPGKAVPINRTGVAPPIQAIDQSQGLQTIPKGLGQQNPQNLMPQGGQMPMNVVQQQKFQTPIPQIPVIGGGQQQATPGLIPQQLLQQGSGIPVPQMQPRQGGPLIQPPPQQLPPQQPGQFIRPPLIQPGQQQQQQMPPNIQPPRQIPNQQQQQQQK